MMTKKHYKQAAETIKQVKRHQVQSDTPATILTRNVVCADIANGLADMFEQDNPKFDRDLFLKACGVDGES